MKLIRKLVHMIVVRIPWAIFAAHVVVCANLCAEPKRLRMLRWLDGLEARWAWVRGPAQY